MVESPFLRHFPEESRYILASMEGQDYLESITEDEFRELILNLLNGVDPRSIFEAAFYEDIIIPMHRAIREMYVAGEEDDESFILNGPITAARWLTGHFKKLAEDYTIQRLKAMWRERNLKGYSNLVHDELVAGLQWGEEIPPYMISEEDRKLCFWLIGSTSGKGWAGQFGRDRERLLPWAENLCDRIETADDVLAIARHAGSLSKKGGLKSMMGNLLEDPVLFAALKLCGLEFCGRNSVLEENGQFTLDLRAAGEHHRQADAAVMISESLIYFDIGWVSDSNPELTADKLQRFQNLSQNEYANTIVIISQAAEGGEVRRIAAETNATLIVMGGNAWVTELHENLVERGLQTELPPIDVENMPSGDDLLNGMKDRYTRPDSW